MGKDEGITVVVPNKAKKETIKAKKARKEKKSKLMSFMVKRAKFLKKKLLVRKREKKL